MYGVAKCTSIRTIGFEKDTFLWRILAKFTYIVYKRFKTLCLAMHIYGEAQDDERYNSIIHIVYMLSEPPPHRGGGLGRGSSFLLVHKYMSILCHSLGTNVESSCRRVVIELNRCLSILVCSDIRCPENCSSVILHWWKYAVIL